ncbi:MAG: hypothetical protein ACE5JQ_13070 [Candidatus Methylomirabilales bacterium]
MNRSVIPYHLWGAVAILHRVAFPSSAVLVHVNGPFPTDQAFPNLFQGNQGNE